MDKVRIIDPKSVMYNCVDEIINYDKDYVIVRFNNQVQGYTLFKRSQVKLISLNEQYLQAKRRLSETDFQFLCIKVDDHSGKFKMYSRTMHPLSMYYHGIFESEDEALYSIELLCERENIDWQLSKSYAKHEIQRNMWSL